MRAVFVTRHKSAQKTPDVCKTREGPSEWGKKTASFSLSGAAAGKHRLPSSHLSA